MRAGWFPGATQRLPTLGAVAGLHVCARLESSLNHLSTPTDTLLQLQKMNKMLSPLWPALNFYC